MDISNSIKAEIKRRGYSVAEVAEQLGQIPSNLSRTINNPNIRISDIQKIGDVIGCEVEDFFIHHQEPSSTTICPYCKRHFLVTISPIDDQMQ